MTGAETVARELKAAGVEAAFVFPGGTISRLLEAIDDVGIRVIVAVSESGAGHSAQGYARASGKLPAVIVTSGPGVSNAITPMCDSYFDYDPVVFLCGQASEDTARPGVAGRGRAWRGEAWRGGVRLGMAWHGVARRGEARHGKEESVRQRGFQWVDTVSLAKSISVWTYEPNGRLDGLTAMACRYARLLKGPAVLSLRGDLLS